MNKVWKYLLAIILTIVSVGAISSSDLTGNNGIDLASYAHAIIEFPKTSYAYLTQSISSLAATMGSEANRAQHLSANEDVNVFGTFIMVVLIAAFSIVRRLD